MRLNLFLGLVALVLFCGGGCGQDDAPGPEPKCITQGCDQQELPRVAQSHSTPQSLLR